MKQSIFYGNGFNYLIKDFPSWSSLVKFEGKAFKNTEIPYTIQFELKMLLTHSDDIINNENEEKKILQSKLKSLENYVNVGSPGLDLYKSIIDLHADNYITTNYDNFLFNYLTIVEGRKVLKQSRPANNYSIDRYYHLDVNNNTFIWNIHGDYKKYSSMIIGYNHYCGTIGKMNDYLKGHYEYKNKKGDKIMNVPIIRRILDDSIYDENIEPSSWIDRFFTTDIHIIGLGLPFDEIDIWWILNYRIRLMTDPRMVDKIKNKIYYYEAYTSVAKKTALEKLGVTVENSMTRLLDDYSNSKDIYDELIDKMEANMIIRRAI